MLWRLAPIPDAGKFITRDNETGMCAMMGELGAPVCRQWLVVLSLCAAGTTTFKYKHQVSCFVWLLQGALENHVMKHVVFIPHSSSSELIFGVESMSENHKPGTIND